MEGLEDCRVVGLLDCRAAAPRVAPLKLFVCLCWCLQSAVCGIQSADGQRSGHHLWLAAAQVRDGSTDRTLHYGT